jgi:hypothetical protein
MRMRCVCIQAFEPDIIESNPISIKSAMDIVVKLNSILQGPTVKLVGGLLKEKDVSILHKDMDVSIKMPSQRLQNRISRSLPEWELVHENEDSQYGHQLVYKTEDGHLVDIFCV